MTSASARAVDASEGVCGAPAPIVEAGLDERQLLALRELHRAWALEEHEHALDEDAWVRQEWGLCNSGQYNVAIAWAGEKPVGCVELFVVYDPMERAWLGHADRAFVAREWREGGVFTLLCDALDAIGDGMGCAKVMAPVGVGGAADFLKEFYEGRGFELSGYTMRRRAPCHNF